MSPPPSLQLRRPAVSLPVRPVGGLRLVVDAVGSFLDGDPAAGFLGRRARQELALEEGRQSSLATGLLDSLATGDRTRLSQAVLTCMGHEESAGHLDEALALLGLGVRLAPECPRMALHEGRLRRKKGDRDGAREAYRRVVVRAPGDSSLCRLAELGEALLAEDALPLLGPLAGRARKAGDLETSGVALEERAQLRARRGASAAVVRDAVRSAACYPDEADRLRVLMFAVQVLSGRGDLMGAREFLLRLPPFRHEGHRARVEQQLRLIARVTGDQVGLRRWRHSAPGSLVTLLPSSRMAARNSGTLPSSGIPRLVELLELRWAAGP